MARNYRTKREQRQRRHARLRRKITGTAERPRLAVCTTGRHVYVQCIDDRQGHTLAAASTLQTEMREAGVQPNMAGAAALGKAAAEKLLAQGISAAVFDRGGFQYHGRIKAVAEAAREAGLKL